MRDARCVGCLLCCELQGPAPASLGKECSLRASRGV